MTNSRAAHSRVHLVSTTAHPLSVKINLSGSHDNGLSPIGHSTRPIRLKTEVTLEEKNKKLPFAGAQNHAGKNNVAFSNR